jgi:hypothetical protein
MHSFACLRRYQPVDCHPADRQLKRKFQNIWPSGLSIETAFPYGTASVFEWFAQEAGLLLS